MVLGVNLSNFFLNTQGLYSLLALLPLIILYLIRPKPREQEVPSLMFFLRDMSKAKRKSFFRRFTQDWLFWLQLLTLLLLATAMAKPFTEVPEESLAKHSIIVLDSSASMQTKMPDGKTRFAKAKEEALDKLGPSNTIILAENEPIVPKQEVDKDEARKFLQELEPSSTSTAIYDAARAALDYVGEDSKVTVLSDFMETEVDSDVNTVKSALRAQGAVVDYVSYASKAANVGITDLNVKEQKTTVQVTNYFPNQKTVPLDVRNIHEELTLKPGGSDVVTFSTPVGVSKVTLDVDDDLPLDNEAHISTPKKTQLDVLLITNNQNIKKTNLYVALKAINSKTNYNLNIQTVRPPQSVNVDHDIIILKQFSQEKILPGIFSDIQEQVEQEGASLIITAQRNLFNYNPIQSLLPVEFQQEVKSGSEITKAKPEIKSLTKDVNFGSTDYYFKTRTKEDARPIAKTNDNGTIIAYQKRGAGSILYYGIFDQDLKVDGDTMKSGFKNDLFYPIFWKRSMDLMTGTPSVDALNRRTGSVINLPEGQEVKTPEGETVSGIFRMDKQGVYQFMQRDIAANLLHSDESDVSGEFTERETEEVNTEEVTNKEPKPLEKYFIFAALAVLLGELLYTKFRGDM